MFKFVVISVQDLPDGVPCEVTVGNVLAYAGDHVKRDGDAVLVKRPAGEWATFEANRVFVDPITVSVLKADLYAYQRELVLRLASITEFITRER